MLIPCDFERVRRNGGDESLHRVFGFPRYVFLYRTLNWCPTRNAEIRSTNVPLLFS